MKAKYGGGEAKKEKLYKNNKEDWSNFSFFSQVSPKTISTILCFVFFLNKKGG